METGVAVTIFFHKNIKVSMVHKYPYPINSVKIFIFMDIEPFFYNFVITKTLLLNHVRYI